MPFPIDRAINQNDPIDERSKETKGDENGGGGEIPNISLSTPSPESLLRATMNPTANDSIKTSNIKMPGDINRADQDETKTRKPLIEEVKPKGKASVKKGFLRGDGKDGKAVPRLYDDSGSSGDGSKEGSYSRLMSKCQVVDMSTMTPEEQKVAMDQHAGNQQKQPQAPPTPPVQQPPVVAEKDQSDEAKMDEVLSGFGKGFLEGKELGGKQKGTDGPTADALFDRIISGVYSPLLCVSLCSLSLWLEAVMCLIYMIMMSLAFHSLYLSISTTIRYRP